MINLSKENLFDKDNVEVGDGYISVSDGQFYSGNSNKCILTYIPVEEEKTYALIYSGFQRILFYDDSKNYISGLNSSSPYIFTTPQNTKYIRMSGSISGENIFDLDTIQLYKDNDYTPYYELCKIGDYKDTLSVDNNGSVVINKNIGKVVLNGSESWNKSGAYSNSYYTKINNSISIPATGDTNIYVYSNNFTRTYKTNITNLDYGVAQSDGNNILFRNKDISTTADDFKTWLSSHNATLYYVLTTPETINLPNAKISLFEGINHIYLIDDLETQTEIKYYSENAFSDIYYTKQETDDHIKDLIPEGGQSGQVLIQDANGELTWGDAADPNAIVGDGSIKKIVVMTYEEYQLKGFV